MRRSAERPTKRDCAGPTPDSGNPSFWAAVAYLAVGCIVFAFLVQTWGVQRTSPSRASLLLGTEPVWTVAVALALGGERLTAVAFTGTLLILAGCWWGQAIEAAHRRPGHA